MYAGRATSPRAGSYRRRALVFGSLLTASVLCACAASPRAHAPPVLPADLHGPALQLTAPEWPQPLFAPGLVGADPRPMAFGRVPPPFIVVINSCEPKTRVFVVLDGVLVGPCPDPVAIFGEFRPEEIASVRYYRGLIAARMFGTRAARFGVAVVETRR